MNTLTTETLLRQTGALAVIKVIAGEHNLDPREQIARIARVADAALRRN